MDKYEEIRVIGRGAFGTAVLVREKAFVRSQCGRGPNARSS